MSQGGIQDWIRAGDLRRAAAFLVVSYGPDVLATCIAMIRDRAAAEDVTQEVFSDALRGLSTFRGESSPRTWLLSIARNRCLDHLRARKRDPWGGALDEDARDPDAHADESAFGSEWHADRSAVLRALDVLAEGDRALIVLRFKNGLEYDELATVFGLREATVRMRVSRALARMRQTLESDAQAISTAALGAGPAAAALPARMPMGALPGSPPPAAAMRSRSGLGGPVSWWTRLEAWAGLGPDAESGTLPSHPIGALGVTLQACEAAPSDALAARLGALVEAV